MDYLTQEEQLKRRRELMQAMMQQGMQGQVSSTTPKGAWAEMLGKLALGLAGQHGMTQADAGLAENREAQNADMQKQMAQYLAQQQGAPAQPQTPASMVGTTGAEFPRPEQEPDPQTAMAMALSSQHPRLQQLGMLQAQTMASRERKVPEMQFTPNGDAYYNTDKGPKFTGQNFAKPEVVNNQVIDPRTGEVKKDYRDKFSGPYQKNGDWYQDDDRGKTVKLDNAPKTTVSVGGPQIYAAKEGMAAWSKDAAKAVSELGANARSAVQFHGSLNQLDKLADGGVHGGVAATPVVWLTNLAQSVGMNVDAGKLANSEAYNSVAQDATQRLIAQFGGNRNVTKEEAAMIAKIVPQLQHSPAARKQLTTIYRRVAQRAIDDYKTANKNFAAAIKADDPSLFDFGPTMLPNEEPVEPQEGMPSGAAAQPAAAAKAAADAAWEELLKKRKIRGN